MAKEPTINNATVYRPPNGGYSFTPQSQTPIYHFAGMDWGYNPETNDLQRVYTNNGTGSSLFGTPAYGSPNPTMPNTSPYTGGVSASNPFPSHMTQYNYSGNAPFTFNEQWYLQQNPDVAAAVQAGQFPSGQAHYQQFGQAEGRQMNSNMPTADPNRIPYSTTNPYEVNPYLNFNVNRAYAIPAPIMNGTWNNLTLPTNIWKPTSYVNQIDQARENAARSDLYNPAQPWVDTSTSSPFTGQTTVHGNTVGWNPSDVNNTAQVNPAATMNPEVAAQQQKLRGWQRKQQNMMKPVDMAKFIPHLNNYTNMFDVATGGYSTQKNPRMVGDKGMMSRTPSVAGVLPTNIFEYWKAMQ